jgi:Uma2 family endonuclease
MAMPAVKTSLAPDEYFRMEAASAERHEYRDGELISMAGVRYAHCQIAANFIRELGNGLRGKPCAVLDGNIRVRIPRKTYYYYPDASVVCGKPEFDPAAPPETTILNPLIVVEVLSESTEAFDRGDKFTDYRAIDVLREYVLVSQRTPRVEAFLRQDDGTWRFSVADGLAAVVRLASIGLDVPLTEIYAGVEFPPTADAS